MLRREQRASEEPHGWGQRGTEPAGRGMGWKKRAVVEEGGSEHVPGERKDPCTLEGTLGAPGEGTIGGRVIKLLFSLLSSRSNQSKALQTQSQ